MNEIVKIAAAVAAGPINPAGSSGYVVRTEVPTAVETLDHLEQTLDNLDPVITDAPFAERFDAAADAVIADITGDASVDAVEPVSVPEGTDDDKAGE